MEKEASQEIGIEQITEMYKWSPGELETYVTKRGLDFWDFCREAEDRIDTENIDWAVVDEIMDGMFENMYLPPDPYWNEDC